MMQAASVRTSAPPTPSAYTPTAHAGDLDRSMIAVANIENALQRVMYELKKASPDMARAQKLTLAAMAAVDYIGQGALQ